MRVVGAYGFESRFVVKASEFHRFQAKGWRGKQIYDCEHSFRRRLARVMLEPRVFKFSPALRQVGSRSLKYA